MLKMKQESMGRCMSIQSGAVFIWHDMTPRENFSICYLMVLHSGTESTMSL